MSEHAEVVASYRGFDFQSLWKGREKTTSLEVAIARDAFRDGRRLRLLDAGVGFGRLFLPLMGEFQQSVGLDANVEGLSRLTPSLRAERTRTLLVVGNVYHLPFVDRAFTEAMMLRVYHHLSRPEKVVKELARVVAPGGTLLISANPGPNLGTWLTAVGDMNRGGWKPPTSSARTNELVQVASTPFPIYADTRIHFNRVLHEAGLHVERTYGAGLEDFRPFRILPLRFLEAWTLNYREAPWVPTVFAKCRVKGKAGSVPRTLAETLACPRCRGTLDISTGKDSRERDVLCERCGPIGTRQGDVLDLTYR